MQRCGKRFTAEGHQSTELRCQREAGHGGAHISEIKVPEALKRYWWVPLTGEHGINLYEPA